MAHTKMNLLAIGVTLTTLAACGSSETTTTQGQPTVSPKPMLPATMKDLLWLTGKWQNKTPGGIAFENWKIADDSTLTGESGFIKGTDTMISETIVLEQRNNIVSYIPTVKNQNEGKAIPFKLIEAAGDSFVFSNPAHDFPDKITYSKKSATAMQARISGKMGGKEAAETFMLEKAE